MAHTIDCVCSKMLNHGLNLKADWGAINSPKKQMNEFGFFAMTVCKYLTLEILIASFKYFRTVKPKKIGLFRFWEYTACQSA